MNAPRGSINHISLQKLPSGVYELSWVMQKYGLPDFPCSGFHTKAQLMTMANSMKTATSIRDFLKIQFRKGDIIK